MGAAEAALKRLSATADKLRDELRPSSTASGAGAAQPLDDERDDDHHRNAPQPGDACLYGLIGDIARAGSDTTEANPLAVALGALAWLGCCLGRGPFLPIGNTYHHPRLFCMHVGRSGRGRKGDALSLIHRIDMALREKWPGLSPQVHRGGLSSREGLAYLIHDGFKEGKNDVEPIHDKRLWIVESEFANVLHQTKRDGNTLSAALRDCWDGVGIKPATKSNRISTSHPHISMSAAVTPSELLSLIEQRELSNGFANRFLTIFAERLRLVPFPQATPKTTVTELAERVAKVLVFVQADRWVDRDHLCVSLSPSAAKDFEALYRSELNRHDFGPLVTGLLERRATVLLRLAMIFALTDMTTVIGPQHIAAGLAWVRYWRDSVQFIFSSGAQEEKQREVSEAAAKIVAFLTEHGRQPRTKLNVECFHGKLSRDKLDAALDELLQATPPAIVVETVARTDGPGNATKFYCLSAKSAKSAKPEHPCGFPHDSPSGEVSEISEVSTAAATSFRSVRSVRQPSNPAETRANADDSLSSLISPAKAGVEVL